MTTLIVVYAFSVTSGQQVRQTRNFAEGDKIVVERGVVLHRGAECPLERRELVHLLRDGVVKKSA
jgi:hypothetical protein